MNQENGTKKDNNIVVQDKMKVVIITGLSGAGKTNASDWFEDHGYYCIDNMPPALIRSFMELSTRSTVKMEKAAFVVDIRSEEFFKDANMSIEYLRSREDIELSILFVEASDSTLIKRYNETRRNHPLAVGKTDKEVIQKERKMLEDIRTQADKILDTTNVRVANFNIEMEKLFGEKGNSESSFGINVISFGFKYGIPQETDMVFDMRFIPNPYYVNSLRKLTGNNKKVQNYVLKFDITKTFITQIRNLINDIAPCYAQEGKNHLNIAFGCTGGQHRSVTLANEMARIFKEEGYRVTLEHREL